MENRSKDTEDRPKGFADLSQEVQRNWALQTETQLFLAQLRRDREDADQVLDAACRPSGLPGVNESRVEARANKFILSYCINTIEAAMGEVAHA